MNLKNAKKVVSAYKISCSDGVPPTSNFDWQPSPVGYKISDLMLACRMLGTSIEELQAQALPKKEEPKKVAPKKVVAKKEEPKKEEPKKVVSKKEEPKKVVSFKDSDKDGIPDYKDKEPNSKSTSKKQSMKKKRKQVRRKKVKKSKPTPSTVADVSDFSEHLLFSMIGANYLSSDYATGEWNPVFEDTTSIITIEEQANKIARQAYLSQNESKYLLSCSWVLLPIQHKKKIYDQITQTIGNDFLSQEFNVKIWKMFSRIAEQLSPQQAQEVMKVTVYVVDRNSMKKKRLVQSYGNTHIALNRCAVLISDLNGSSVYLENTKWSEYGVSGDCVLVYDEYFDWGFIITNSSLAEKRMGPFLLKKDPNAKD